MVEDGTKDGEICNAPLLTAQPLSIQSWNGGTATVCVLYVLMP
jgi:hypothetical protein